LPHFQGAKLAHSQRRKKEISKFFQFFSFSSDCAGISSSKDVDVFAKTCTSFSENMYIFLEKHVHLLAEPCLENFETSVRGGVKGALRRAPRRLKGGRRGLGAQKIVVLFGTSLENPYFWLRFRELYTF